MYTNVIEKFDDKQESLTIDNKQIEILFRKHKRDYQQDSYLVKEYPNGLLVAVADGMGGHPNGDLASQETIEVLSESFDHTKLTEVDLRSLVSKIESTISSYRDHRGTTLVVAFIQDHQIIIIHIGDSYLSILDKENKLSYKTKPQEDIHFGYLLNCIGFEVPSLSEVMFVPNIETKTIALYSDGLEDLNVTDLSRDNGIIEPKQFDSLSTDNQTLVLITCY